jgi:hypothetical protein
MCWVLRSRRVRRILLPFLVLAWAVALAPGAQGAATQATVGPSTLAASGTALIPVEFANLSNSGSSNGYLVPGKGKVTKVRFYAQGGLSAITSGIIIFAGARKAGDPTKFVIRDVSGTENWTGPGTGTSGIGEQAFSFPVFAGEALGISWSELSLGVFREDPALNPPAESASAVAAPTPAQELPVVSSNTIGPLQVQYIVDLAPSSTNAPSTGANAAPVVGQALTAYPGAWDSSPTAFTYQWQSCAADGTGCAAISGANSQSYTPATGDVGRALRVQVTASNATGGAGDPANSAPTAAVVATSPSPPPPSTRGAGVSAPSPNTPPQPKVTLCHSGNGRNYTTITVAPEAAINGHAKNHDDDIIPPFDYVKNGRTLQYAGQNWGAQGRAIFNAGCQSPAQNPANRIFNPPPPPPPSGKVTICHSGNGRNYTRITVAPQAAFNGHARRHADDIIPPFSSRGISFPGLNWDAAGQAIWSNGCARPAPVTNPLQDPAKRVSLCHSAGGTSYVSIEVAPAVALSGHSIDHPDDIIPPFTYREGGTEKTFAGLNWGSAGQATFNNGCVTPTPPPTQPTASPVVPTVSCVDVTADGSFTAYFGYRSDGLVAQTVATGPDNFVSVDPPGSGAISTQPTTFQPGSVGTAVTVSGISAGASATWSITAGATTSTATATAGSTRCVAEPAPVDFGLFAVCSEKGADGTYSVTFGYQNDNVLPISAPVGKGNRVLIDGAGNLDRGQPASLAAGRSGNAFKVSGLNAGQSVAWEITVAGLQRLASADSSTPACAGTIPEPTPKPQNREPVGPSVRCVARNGDGTYNVVFGYSNPNAVTVVVAGGAANAVTVSPGDPGPDTRGQPTAFQPGSVANAFTVMNVPAGQETTWTVASYGTRSATAGIGYPERCAGETPEKTPNPPRIDPQPGKQALGIYLKCVDADSKTYSATFGYVNPGSIALTIPVGEDNRFTGSNPDRGQPTVFAPGEAAEAFRVRGIGIRQRPSWKVVGPDGKTAIATADPAAPNCTTGDPKRGPQTDVEPKLPPRKLPPTPVVTEISNPGTEIDWKPKTTIELPPPLRPQSVTGPDLSCRRSGRTIICRAGQLLPGQVARVVIRTRCVRAGSGLLAIASVVRNVALKPGRVASGSGLLRVRRCGPRYTG